MLFINIKYDVDWPRELLERRTQYMIDVTGRHIVREIKRNINNGISIYGGRLAPLKLDTIRRKKGLRHPKKALYALGMLYKSIHYYTGHRENKGSVGIIDRGSPSRRYLALIHQTGAYKGGVARPFFGISKDCDRHIRGMWESWFVRITGNWKFFRHSIIAG